MPNNSHPGGREMIVVPGTNVSLGKRTFEIISYVFDNPHLTYEQMAKNLGISGPRISKVMKHPKVLQAFPMLGRLALSRMAPDAIKAYRDVIKQNDSMPAKEKASARALTELGIFNPPQVEVKNTLEIKPTEELIELIKRNQSAEIPSVDTEVVPDDSEPT